MRKLNWLEELTTYFDSCVGKEFQWGTFDCCLFAADCCVAIAGSDPAAAYRGQYDTEWGAKATLAATHGSLAAAFGALYQPIDPAMAQRGDVVLFETDLGVTAGIQYNNGVWSVGLNGLVFLANPEVTHAWRVE